MRRKQKGTEPKFWVEQLEPRLLLSTTSGLESTFTSSLLENEVPHVPVLVIQADEFLANNNNLELTEDCESGAVLEPIIMIDLNTADSQQGSEIADNDLTIELTSEVDNVETTIT